MVACTPDTLLRGHRAGYAPFRFITEGVKPLPYDLPKFSGETFEVRFLRKCNIDTAKIVAPRKRSTGQAFALSPPFHTKKYVVSYSAFLSTNIGFADKRNDVGRNEAASR